MNPDATGHGSGSRPDVQSHHLPAGTTARAPWALEVTPRLAGWHYSALRTLQLAPGGRHTFATGAEEMIVLPLAGSCQVECDWERFDLAGRESVFAAVSDFVYLPRDATVTVSTRRGGRFALPAARCERRLAPRYRAATDVPVELRGAGSCSRQVNNFAAADTFDCDRLIAVEVLTPGGNWSSYPPHKHDEPSPRESVLEEIYYFETAGGGPGGGTPGFGYQRVYGSSAHPIDVLAEVRTGDVVLIPHGWHGPSIAAPGHDLYYLNVMAGPDPERAWRIRDDPAHAWVRDSWADQPVDPRLPLAAAPRPGAAGPRDT